MVNDQQQPAPQPEPLTLSFGKGVILASNPDFLNGFEIGQNAYLAALRIHPEPYADGYLVELFLDKLEDIRLTSPYGVGYAGCHLCGVPGYPGVAVLSIEPPTDEEGIVPFRTN